MEYVEVLKYALIKNNLENLKEIELTCFADIYSLVEDAAGNWRPDKLKRDDFFRRAFIRTDEKYGFSKFIRTE